MLILAINRLFFTYLHKAIALFSGQCGYVKDIVASLLANCDTNTGMSLWEWVGAYRLDLDRHSVVLVQFQMCMRCVRACACVSVSAWDWISFVCGTEKK